MGAFDFLTLGTNTLPGQNKAFMRAPLIAA